MGEVASEDIIIAFIHVLPRDFPALVVGEGDTFRTGGSSDKQKPPQPFEIPSIRQPLRVLLREHPGRGILNPTRSSRCKG